MQFSVWLFVGLLAPRGLEGQNATAESAGVWPASAEIAKPRRLLNCQVTPSNRRNCGYPGIGEGACGERGCCFQQPFDSNVPTCFFSATEMYSECVPSDGDDDCGSPGIDETDCVEKGCCFIPQTYSSSASCFKKHAPMVGRYAELPQSCAMPDADRIDCGFDGITEDQCIDKGCCYFRSSPGHPFCYYKIGKAPPHLVQHTKKCQLREAERIDCGYDGVTELSCLSRGCCYKHPSTPGVPYCFYLKGGAPPGVVEGSPSRQCVMSDLDRVDCGFQAVTPHQCRAAGCCYFHSHMPGSPFCFYGKDKVPTEANRSGGEKCVMGNDKKVNCMPFQAGVTQAQCEAKGCCFHLEANPTIPMCYFEDVAFRETSSPPPSTSFDCFKSDPRGGLNFRGSCDEGTRKQQTQDESASRNLLMSILGLTTLVLVCAAFWCYRSAPAKEQEDDTQKDQEEPLVEVKPLARLLSPDTELYRSYEDEFTRKWNPSGWPKANGCLVAVPRISAIYEIDSDARAPVFDAKKREIISYSATPSQGSELPGVADVENPWKEAPEEASANLETRFHGARLKCDFCGTPCADPKCSVCRVIDSGSFARDSIEGEIHFRATSHAAKGQGLAPGKTPPPKNLDHFVDQSAGNAVFIADVLQGNPQVVVERTKGALPEGTHSRIADTDKTEGVDEIVVFDDAQALPKALIVFEKEEKIEEEQAEEGL